MLITCIYIFISVCGLLMGCCIECVWSWRIRRCHCNLNVIGGCTTTQGILCTVPPLTYFVTNITYIIIMYYYNGKTAHAGTLIVSSKDSDSHTMQFKAGGPYRQTFSIIDSELEDPTSKHYRQWGGPIASNKHERQWGGPNQPILFHSVAVILYIGSEEDPTGANNKPSYIDTEESQLTKAVW